MNDNHKQHAKSVRATIPLTTRALNKLAQKAHEITLDPTMVIAHHEWLQDLLAENHDIIDNLAAHKQAVAASFESALTGALFLLPHEELAKRKGDAHTLDFHAPETIDQLRDRLDYSVKYAQASLGQIKGLTPTSRDYCLQVYGELQDHLYKIAQDTLKKPPVKGV